MKQWLCGECGGATSGAASACGTCGSASIFGIASKAIVAVPAGQPCGACRSATKPLRFRGWVRRTAFLIGSTESRASDYVCAECAERRAAGALAWTGVAGWWSISSFLFRTPIATFHNWRAAFGPPANPLAWGAVPVDRLVGADAGKPDAATVLSIFRAAKEGEPE